MDKPVRHIYLYFNDGNRLALSYPEPEGGDDLTQRFQTALCAPYVSIEVDGDLLLIPRESIKYMQICPLPKAHLPETSILGAKMMD